MKNQFLVFIIILFLPSLSNAQKNKRFKETNISVSTTFNLYPSVDTYTWENSFWTQDRGLILKYTTAASGSFVITEGDSVKINRVHTSKLLDQPLGVGATIRFANVNEYFHEFSLTKLSISKSSNLVLDTYSKEGEDAYTIPRTGYIQKAFVFGARYEFGKVFGDSKNSRVRFGLSAGIEPTFYSFNGRPQTSVEYPTTAKFTTIDATFNPILTVRLSKKVTIDFKLISSVLLHTFGYVRESDPNRTFEQQETTVEYNFPELDFAYNLAIRYTLKEAIIDKKKKNRKRKKRRRR